jgi:UDPglucose 6-dehydrogenase
MKIVVVGTGYVGLVSGVCFAEIGHKVTCVDVDATKVASINRGIAPIHEEGLQELIERQVREGRLTATTRLNEAMVGADISMIAVGTPFDGAHIDLVYVKAAASQIGACLPRDRFHVVCVKSTVVPGTTTDVVGPLLEAASGLKAEIDFGLCMNPEFLAEGTAVRDFMHPDRIVIGTRGQQTEAVMRELYSPFSESDVFVTSPTTAEMGKYTANALLATLISFSNEIADICSRCEEVDAVNVMRTVYLDRRLSPITKSGRLSPGILSFLHAGTGFGGSCFPKDLKALAAFGAVCGGDTAILEAVIARNAKQPFELIKLLEGRLGCDLSSRRITVLGLAFKPGTDDIRESPAIQILRMLCERNAQVIAHDPIAVHNMRELFPNIKYAPSMASAIENTDAILLVTAWPEYKELPVLLKGSTIPLVDGRRFIPRDSYDHYSGIGIATPHLRAFKTPLNNTQLTD